MTLAVGDKIPQFKFKVMTDDGPGEITTSELFDGKKVVMFAVPGAFTPTCNMNHLPGYLNHLDDIKSKGVDDIAVLSVNDVFVINQWAEASNGKGKLRFLADGSAQFTKQVGMDIDLSEPGLGVRSKRYAMIVEDGVVISLNVEDSPAEAKASTAEAILEQL